MKANVERGRGFRGVLDYAFGDTKGAEIVGGNMIGADPKSLAREFGLSRQARPEVQRPVWHCSLSCPPGEHLTAEQWHALAADFMKIMGLDAHQYTAIRHGDRPLDHIHIIASRITLDGELWHGKFEMMKAINATQRLEREHGLTLTPGLDDIDAHDHKKTPTKAEIEKMDRTGEAPARLKLQEILDTALLDDEPQSIFAFIDQLEAAGVGVRLNLASTGRMNGFSFEIDGVPFKGSQLGKGYSWKKLQEKGIQYEQERDCERLRARIDRGREADFAVRGGEPAPIDDSSRGHVTESDAFDRGKQISDRDDASRLPAEAGSVSERDREIEYGDDGSSQSSEIDAGPASDDDPDGADRRDIDWYSLSDDIADLAAPAAPRPVFDQSVSVSAAVKAKQRAWDQQHGALDAPQYRLTLKSRVGDSSFNLGKGRGEGGLERFYDADEVRNLIPYLSRQNVLGRDIYLTPIDLTRHFIVIDDMSPQSLADFKAEGYQPALVQESSENNFQAVLIVPRKDLAKEQKMANSLVSALNKTYGDPKFSGVVHPLRMAGFSNKKPGRNNAFTRVVEAVGGVCMKAVGALSSIRKLFLDRDKESAQQRAAERLARRSQRETPAPAPAPTADVGACAEAYDRLRAQHEKTVIDQGWIMDQSRVDFRVCVDLLSDGHPESDVIFALRTRSPEIETRHSNTDDYSRRTVEAARAEVSKRRRCVTRDPGDDGPGF